ncbi:LexA family protein [Pantoea trifolii]|uniref:LexA family protein n=1 Tax=Candidatus Pantoea symbiotica TaxID=1884370 RepID=UPI0024130BEA|nr:FeoC-like transcriptional regulator [Pantoea rodasii]
MNTNLTRKQSALIDFIRSFTAEHGVSPSYIDMGKHFGVHASSAHQMVEVMIRKGHVKRVKGASRGLALTDYADVEIPDINDSEYWYDGVFKPQLYQRDVVDAIKSAGMKVKEFA